MPERFEKTSLWRRTLALQPDDQHADAREALRRGYLDMRSASSALVAKIQHDCPDLTVHDVTHLDALWETADLIIGPDFEINPAEAFVFGASVLLHDAAMSLAAYQNGLNDLLTLSEWADASAELAGEYEPEPSRRELVSTFSDRLRTINGENGTAGGRAALSYEASAGSAVISVDGFVQVRARMRYADDEYIFVHDQVRPPSLRGIVGVVLGTTDDASRKSAALDVGTDAIAAWASEQATLIPLDKFKPDQLMGLANVVLELGGDPGPVPSAFLAGKFVGLRDVRDWLRSSVEMIIPLRVPYGNTLRVASMDGLSSDFFLLLVGKDVVVPWPSEMHQDLLDKMRLRDVVEDNRSDIFSEELEDVLSRTLPKWFNGLLKETWPEGMTASIARYNMFESDLLSPPAKRWGLKLQRKAPGSS